MYKEDTRSTDLAWICPFCKHPGHPVNKFYGVCRKINCLAVCPSGTVQDIEMGGPGHRKVESLWIDYSDTQPTPGHRAFFTDGAGENCNPSSGLRLTGWATVEVKVEINPTGEGLTIKKHRVIKDRSPGSIKSIPWCEGKAILEAVMQMHPGNSIHVITDSKVTVQAIKTLLSKRYRKCRKIANKPLLDAIITALQACKGRLMLEWVKSHNTESLMKERNWISDMKIIGNRWADQEAGSTVAPNSSIDTPMNESIKGKLRDKTTGSILEWGHLHKMVRLQCIKARQDRLSMPSKACFIFGQGNYSREALVDRNLMWGTLLKKF